jgi:8-oxo-dGTP pyrophosphatase MutT (NUDIX family)
MAGRKSSELVQYAALPWRVSDAGVLEVMLLTSRGTHRWIIPKGWPMKGKKPAEVASREAYEEAGLVGESVGKRPIGFFHYAKRLTRDVILCEVQVFLFRVEQQLDNWPEKSERTTQWFEANEAASMVDEGGLAEIIAAYASRSSLSRALP